MIKRCFNKDEHANENEDADPSSSSSSGSDWPLAEEDEKVDKAEEEEEVETAVKGSLQEGSGYESEDISANEIDSSGLQVNDDDMTRGEMQNHGDSRQASTDNVGSEEICSKDLSKALKPWDSILDEEANNIVKRKSVFRCRLCPRIVCLNEETLIRHLKSKRHARSKKLLGEGRLKLMLNSDGEIEEDQETHSERHARTISVAQDESNLKRKSKGQKRPRMRKQKKLQNGRDEDKARYLEKSSKKMCKTKD